MRLLYVIDIWQLPCLYLLKQLYKFYLHRFRNNLRQINVIEKTLRDTKLPTSKYFSTIEIIKCMKYSTRLA
jgi:hypothetical protein